MQEEPRAAEPIPLQPALQEAEQVLRQSLGEVCSTDPTRADTGEMIRLDEMLAIAGEAAKRAVSLRRRLRQEGRPVGRTTRPSRRRGAGTADAGAAGDATAAAPDAAPAAPTGEAPTLGDEPPSPAASPAVRRRSADASRSAVEGAALEAADTDHRTFRDARGVTWSVCAVYPQSGTRRVGLRGAYADGWLTFVCELEKRRLSPVPDGWTTLDDAALEALCVAAEVARPESQTRRMRPIEGD